MRSRMMVRGIKYVGVITTDPDEIDANSAAGQIRNIFGAVTVPYSNEELPHRYLLVTQ